MFNNLDKMESFVEMTKTKKELNLKELLSPERIESYEIKAGGGLKYNYSAKLLNSEVIENLQKLSDEQNLIKKYKSLLDGEIMNTGENRKVLHHLVRGQLGTEVLYEDKNLRNFYVEQQERINTFAKKVHNGEIKGSTGKPFTRVIQIGIGGSDLGPRALYLALYNYVTAKFGRPRMCAQFISNVDPDDAYEVLSNLDMETTLFILVSKSGTTQETLTNYKLVIDKMSNVNINGFNPNKHMIAVTSETSPLAKSDDFLDSFYIDDFIGGRYSSTSAVGGAVLTLAFGKEVFSQILEGAHEADREALNPDIKNNPSLMDALIGVYERNILDLPSTAILPYSQGLSRFPAHLQQLDMESNGKQVNRDGDSISYKTGPVIFGEPGTNGQHSFFQLLHQGTDIIPLQFIGFKNSQGGSDIDYEGSTSQEKLNANLCAQIIAFALGKSDSNPNKNFPGERPSSLIYGDQLTPKSLGALLAHFENKVMFQGFAWNINSFDQEGVQLGKILTKQVLGDGKLDPVLEKYAKILGVK